MFYMWLVNRNRAQKMSTAYVKSKRARHEPKANETTSHVAILDFTLYALSLSHCSQSNWLQILLHWRTQETYDCWLPPNLCNLPWSVPICKYMTYNDLQMILWNVINCYIVSASIVDDIHHKPAPVRMHVWRNILC